MTRLLQIESAGVTLATEVSGEGTPVVYLHGLGGCRQYAREQWGPEGGVSQCQLITFDQRGHGDSSPVAEPAAYHPHLLGEDIAAVLDALQIRRAVVGGASMGACAALHFALAHPERTVALLQTGPAFHKRPNRARRRLLRTARMLALLRIEGTVAALTAEWLQLNMPPEAIAEMARLYRSYHPMSIAAAHRAVANWTVSLEPLRELRVPTFILAWEGDPQHDIAIAREMAELLPNARLEVIPGVFTPNLGARYWTMLQGELGATRPYPLFGIGADLPEAGRAARGP
jgi:pimeloyl-ACP methyl ester carboxylesterase